MAGRSPHQQNYTGSRFDIPLIHEPSHRPRSPTFYASWPDRSRTLPMSIASQTGATPPPPLPPPRWIEGISEGSDPGWEFENRAQADQQSNTATVKPGSSLLGGQKISPVGRYNGPARNVEFDQPPPAPLRIEDLLTDTEARGEGAEHGGQRIPDLRALLEYNKLQSEQHMGKKTLERSSQAYDKSLLSRIGGPRTPPLRAADSPTSHEETPTSIHKTAKHLRPLAMPERRYSDMDTRTTHNGGQWSSTAGLAPAGAPQSSGVSPGISGLRSPLSENGHSIERTHSHSTAGRPGAPYIKAEENPMPGRLLHRNSYDGVLNDHEYSVAQSPAMQQLNIQSQSPAGSEDYQSQRIGQKRRAQSPPSESVLDPRLPNTAHRAAENRNSQLPPRFPGPSSFSSAASSLPQNPSYPSSYGLSNASSATSYNSERLSPGAFESAAARQNLNMQSQPSNLSTAAPRIPQHGRAASTASSRPVGLWICDCCPKKPKKFDTEADLRLHEMEKQYICQYCHNRFKNKNEAERHQNSLHLRRHSWSCAALTSFEAAFHPTPTNNMAASLRASGSMPYNPHNPAGGLDPNNQFPGLLHSTPTDTCGYCGLEFNNPPNWDERVDHLNLTHKFGECNQSKKFFRADHFRQHLKHSHAGTSGKWTNMLENACMKDEPPPVPLAHPGLPPGMPGIMMVGQQALYAHAMQQDQQQQQQQQHQLATQAAQQTQQAQQQAQMQLPQPAGQQALMNATGPMGSGSGAPTPMPGMMSPRESMLSPGMHQGQQDGHSPGYFAASRYQNNMQEGREELQQ